MLAEHFNEINRDLALWRKTQNITCSQLQESLVSDLLEELCEFSRARNSIGRVGALSRIYMLLINSFELQYEENLHQTKNYCGGVYSLFMLTRVLSNMFDEESVEPKIEDKHITIALSYIKDFIRKMGFDDTLCLQESLKQLRSYSGSYSKESKSFVKSFGAYTFEEAQVIADKEGTSFNVIAHQEMETYWVFDNQNIYKPKKTRIKKWYKPNYEFCKIKDSKNKQQT